MNAAVFRALIYADSRLLWRDPLLGWILALPIGLALLVGRDGHRSRSVAESALR